MVRSPRCEKIALKRGAWSPEEDQKLIAYINRYGIWNWSEMPKPAGLTRSGKSCRLRWVNYLRPDIKRGNFSKEEETTILKLHERLGNRWSAIAAGLPGRTDNEIKNYWHTHLKKRTKNESAAPTAEELEAAKTFIIETNKTILPEIDLLLPDDPNASKPEEIPMSPQLPTVPATVVNNVCSLETFGELQSVWAQPCPMEDLYMVEDSQAKFIDPEFILPGSDHVCLQEPIYPCGSFNGVIGNDFWAN